MPYLNLSRDAMYRLALDVPQRDENTRFHTYVKEVNDFRALRDDVIKTIPEPFHTFLGNDGKHEGGMLLNERMNQYAKWLNSVEYQISVRAGSVSTFDAEQAGAQEAFANAGEAMFAEGTELHRFGQEVAQSLAKCGVAIVRQHPRQGYYAGLPKRRFADEEATDLEFSPDFDKRFKREGDDRDDRSFRFREQRSFFEARLRDYRDQTFLPDLWLKECVPPESFSYIEDATGGMAATVERRVRPLGQLAQEHGLKAAHELFGYFDFGRGARPEDPTSWPQASVETREVWTPDQGMLFAVAGAGSASRKRGGRPGTDDGALLATWPNQLDRVPYSARASGPLPWVSDLDLMVQLTGDRNHWATMKYAQARLAIFSRPQAEEKPGDEMDDAEPQTLDWKPGELPSLPGGARWIKDPFAYNEHIFREYLEVVRQHEASGASVARLMGSETGEHTAVATAEAIEETSMRAFSDSLQSAAFGLAAEWRTFFRWLKVYHRDDPVLVQWVQLPPPGVLAKSQSIALMLRGRDVVSENISVKPVPHSLINQVALKKMADEGIANNSWTYEHAVEMGWIPGVNDANFMQKSIYVAKMRQGFAQNRLEASLEEHKALLAGTQLVVPETEETDMTGQPLVRPVGQGPGNVRNSPIAPATAGGAVPRPMQAMAAG